jgi:hypothetical protein
MSDRNLLITIIDTNPVWWGMQSAGLILSNQSSQYTNINSNSQQDNVKYKEEFRTKTTTNLESSF